MTSDSKIETPQRVGPLAPGSVTYALFRHMADAHGLTLLESEMAEIVRIVNDNLEARLRWWITNAEDIAKERGELFRVGEELAARLAADADQTEGIARLFDESPPEYAVTARALVAKWSAAAQPIRDMASSPNGSSELTAPQALKQK